MVSTSLEPFCAYPGPFACAWAGGTCVREGVRSPDATHALCAPGHRSISLQGHCLPVVGSTPSSSGRALLLRSSELFAVSVLAFQYVSQGDWRRPYKYGTLPYLTLVYNTSLRFALTHQSCTLFDYRSTFHCRTLAYPTLLDAGMTMRISLQTAFR